MNKHILPPFIFEPSSQSWRPWEPDGGTHSTHDTRRSKGQPSWAKEMSHCESLSVVTYNIWFGEIASYQRWAAILDQLQDLAPDIIALQEVTHDFLGLLRANHWIRNHFMISDAYGTTIQSYGVVILSRIVPEHFTLYDLPSKMGRKLLLAGFPGSIAVSTIHLESLRPSRPLRERQFAQCVEILSSFDHAVFMGDMNFCSSWPQENRRVPADYADVWPTLRPEEPGYTVDSVRNPMLSSMGKSRKQTRYDRIFLRTSQSQWRPERIQLIGTSSIGDNEFLFPSDHFGLWAQFTRHLLH